MAVRTLAPRLDARDAEATATAVRVVLDVESLRTGPGTGRTTSLWDPPLPGGGLANHETCLPSGEPLSTRTRAEEGPWGRLETWGGGPYPAELLLDSDLAR